MKAHFKRDVNYYICKIVLAILRFLEINVSR